jgi:serine/threonine protein kinase
MLQRIKTMAQQPPSSVKKKEKLFSKPKIWNFQMLQALAYMHRHGYLHQDLKPGRSIDIRVGLSLSV